MLLPCMFVPFVQGECRGGSPCFIYRRTEPPLRRSMCQHGVKRSKDSSSSSSSFSAPPTRLGRAMHHHYPRPHTKPRVMPSYSTYAHHASTTPPPSSSSSAHGSGRHCIARRRSILPPGELAMVRFFAVLSLFTGQCYLVFRWHYALKNGTPLAVAFIVAETFILTVMAPIQVGC